MLNIGIAMASSNNTSPLIPVPPIPAAYWTAAVTPAVNFLIISVSMGAVEVVMLCALLFFSTPALRRSLVFFLNLIAILIGIVKSIVNCYPEAIQAPTAPSNTDIVLFLGILGTMVPTYIDCTLLVRLYAVYASRRVSRLTMSILLGLPLLLNAGRIANAIVYCVKLQQSIEHPGEATGIAGGDFIRFDSVKVEWILQIFDDCYSSGLFLFPLLTSGVLLRQGATVSRNILTLFWISVTNFVFPVILSVVQLIIYEVLPLRVDIALYVQEINFHITIISVVFATVWVFEGRWAEKHGLIVTTGTVASQFSSIRFGDAVQQDGSGMVGKKQTETHASTVSEKTQNAAKSDVSIAHLSVADNASGDVERGMRGNSFSVVVV
ncbi:hypothetical protein EIP91_004226 [Steccherinum ochraceum]|uniref:Uncharacterized protein n=1 Tax=Steccherinum ochraceum TaxID=92696 RepID=A0A4V2MVZ7_9APHY|nr:hypothetical protein EIP91_004226 [Steccherinum ochraceum]